jgi:uncharacterized membrane protein HdeD (DUF308 family)
VLAVLAGVATFAHPGLTFEALVLLFGIYALLDGVLWPAFGLLAASEHERWLPLVVSGIVGIAVGVLTSVETQSVALALVYVVGAWAVVTGALEIVSALRFRQVMRDGWLVALSGALSIVFGVLVIVQPSAGAYALTLIFGFYAILAGVTEVWFGFRLRSLGDDLTRPIQTPRRPPARADRTATKCPAHSSEPGRGTFHAHAQR